MSDIGDLALDVALLLAFVGLGTGVAAGVRRRPDWTQMAERCLWAVFGFTTLAMVALFYAFANHDFQLAYVAQHSARSMTLSYRLAALWGGQSGSLLLWLWMLTAYGVGALVAHRRSSRSLMPWVTAMLLANCIFFLVLLNFSTNPFEKLPPSHVLSDGNGLNPLLQHPVMLIHPLMLYVGFVGFAVPFAFAFAALVTGELDTTWFRTTRRWTLFAWSFLGVGILLGGRWAYEVLGWGGYWAWDPVENASLMPWLVGTAYIHSVMIQEKRDMLKIWNLVLIGLTYTLCLFGTFLTRSGVVQSVHSFTNSGWFGYIFLAYVVAIALVFFTALYLRRGRLRARNRLESVVSREASFLLNNWAFMVLLVAVFVGTLFPVFSETLTSERITVGPKFFNTLAGPLALMLLFLTGVGPLIAWRRASPASLQRQFLWPALVGGATALGLVVLLWGTGAFWSIACWSLSAFVVATVVQEFAQAVRARTRRGEGAATALATLFRKNQRRYGGYVVHLGIVFILVGVAGAAFEEERLENIRPGDSLRIHTYRLEYLTAEAIPAQHYGGAKARIALYQGDEGVAIMAPEKRQYWLEDQPASIPSIYSTLQEDLYVILTELEADGSATLKLYRNPLVNWIWLGGYVFVLGSLLVMWPHPERPRESPTE
ncbi:MAG: heme lyase CcmF/NrfE family subunit [Proteobacteria bacterium]|nr:heme lyase CcmF/NrfE family subunit [Pseudomonadota bacterium]